MNQSNLESPAIAATAQVCDCDRRLPAAVSLHIYKCECGRLWLRPDCSEICALWEAY